VGTNAVETEVLLSVFEKQIVSVKEAMTREPHRKNQILTVYISNFHEAIKQAVRKHGSVIPLYFFLADTPNFGTPPVTDEVICRAKELNADAIVFVEGFQAHNDISDVIYHVSMSAPCLGVLGWVFKVKLHDGEVDIVREMTYIFDSPDKVKTIGELVEEMEGALGE